MTQPHRRKQTADPITAHLKKHDVPPALPRTRPSQALDRFCEPAFWYVVQARSALAVEFLTGNFGGSKQVPALVSWPGDSRATSLVWIIGANTGHGSGGRFDLEDGTVIASMSVHLGRPYAAVAPNATHPALQPITPEAECLSKFRVR